MNSWLFGLVVVAGALAPAEPAGSGEKTPLACELAAVEAELARGVAQLRLEDGPSPYLATARIMRWKSLALDGSYGGVITDVEEQQAAGSMEVRVGSASRDNSNIFGLDGAQSRFLLSFVPEPDFTRRKIWLSMDVSFRTATSTFAAKQAILDRLAGDPLPSDLGPAPQPIPRAKLAQAQESGWALGAVELRHAELRALAAELSSRFREHPKIDNGDVFFHVLATDQSVVSSEGMLLRDHGVRAVMAVTAQSQAADGMLLDHADAVFFQEVPVADDALRRQGEAMVDRVLRELVELAEAPMIEEDYDGPLLFVGPAAAQLLATTVATQAAGTPAPLADGGRLRELEPHWQNSLGKSVLPDYIDLVDDPTAPGFGHYERDAEGFPAQRTELVKGGVLKQLLMTRAPNGSGLTSNGHARMSPMLQVGPAISNLTLTSRKRGVGLRQLERELLRRAREDGYEFAYVIELLRDGNILGPVPREGASTFGGGRKVAVPIPARVFRIEPGGKRTLVRGVVFSPVSMRVLRRIRAIGKQQHELRMRIPVGPLGGFAGETGMDGILSHTVDVQVTTPDLLIDGFELLVERGENERLPTLLHPLRDPDWKFSKTTTAGAADASLKTTN